MNTSSRYAVAVSGPREISKQTEAEVVAWAATLDHNNHILIHGNAKGVDKTAKNAAEKFGMLTKPIDPSYSQYGNAAPLVRNGLIVSRCDELHVFWHGKPYGGTLSTAWMYWALHQKNPNFHIIAGCDYDVAMETFKEVCAAPPQHWRSAYETSRTLT